MPRKSFYIFKDEKIEVGWLAGDNSKTKHFSLIVPPECEITGISVYMRSEMYGGWCNGAYTRLKINGWEACKVTWGVNDTSPKECRKDVTGIVSKGSNEFTVECHKDPIGCFAPRTWKVTVLLTVEYEGKEPDITPPAPDWEWIKQYVPWIAVALVAGVLGVEVIKRESRKKSRR